MGDYFYGKLLCRITQTYKVKDQWAVANKELKDVIGFPKEANGKSNQRKQG